MPAAQSRRHGAQGGRERPSRHRRHPPGGSGHRTCGGSHPHPSFDRWCGQAQAFESSSLLKESMGKISREYEKQSQGDDTLSVEEIKKRTESEPVVKMASLIFNEAIQAQRFGHSHRAHRTRRGGSLPDRRHAHPAHGCGTEHVRAAHLAHQDHGGPRHCRKARAAGRPYPGTTTMGRCSISVCQLYLPTTAKKTVIRILKHDMGLLDLANIGIPHKEYAELAELIEKPQGMVFVTGQPGRESLPHCSHASTGSAARRST